MVNSTRKRPVGRPRHSAEKLELFSARVSPDVLRFLRSCKDTFGESTGQAIGRMIGEDVRFLNWIENRGRESEEVAEGEDSEKDQIDSFLNS